MAELDPKKVLQNLKNKGFKKAWNKSTDHHWVHFFYNEKLVTSTKVSHTSKSGIDDHLIGKMSRQCQLSKKQFLDLVKCPMSKEAYLEILGEKGLLE